MCRMPKAQGQYTSKEGAFESYYTRTRCLAFPDNSYGLYRQTSHNQKDMIPF
jgi:hypothetical protein